MMKRNIFVEGMEFDQFVTTFSLVLNGKFSPENKRDRIKVFIGLTSLNVKTIIVFTLIACIHE